jgi:DNA-binding MarR family transcriptional regulator
MTDDFSQCLVLNTRMAARAVTRRTDRKLRPHGVTAAQFNILAALHSRPARSVTEMAGDLAMERSTLSRNLRLLVGKGLVRTHPAEHGNGRLGVLTAEGEALVERLAPEWRQSHEELCEILGKPDLPSIIVALKRLARL